MGEQAQYRHLSGSEIRRVVQLRERLRDGIIGLHREAQRDVLRALGEARRRRLGSHGNAWEPPAMTPAELIREIRWRVDAAPLDELTAAAAALERAKERAARGVGTVRRTRRSPGG